MILTIVQFDGHWKERNKASPDFLLHDILHLIVWTKLHIVLFLAERKKRTVKVPAMKATKSLQHSHILHLC